jgi:2-haloacid dehalogenase
MELRAILFDTFGTLVDWRGSLTESLGAWGAEAGVSADWAGLADAWRGEYAPSMNQVRRGERAWAELDTLQRESLARLAPRFGLRLDGPALDRLTLLWHQLKPWPDSAGGLARLRHRFLLAPLSNGNTALLADLARYAGLPFDTLFGADVFQHYKPDPQTYLGACRLFSAAPAQVMMCAAHNGDLAAARRHGLRTAFIPRPTEHGPAQSSDLLPEQDWDVVAPSIEALADHLGC